MENNNNTAYIYGTVVSDYEFSHEIHGEKFYQTKVKVQRLSGNSDTILVMVSENLVDVNETTLGSMVYVRGQFRSYNDKSGEKTKLRLFLFATEIEDLGENTVVTENYVRLSGFLCKPPVFRETPGGRCITDILLAVNRSHGRSDYIPCVCWGRAAKYTSKKDVGQNVTIVGRIQSREYRKKLSETEFEMRVAYEVSTNKIEFEEGDEQP